MWQRPHSERPRIVIKLGSSSVTRETGPDPTLLASTLDACLEAHKAGWDCVLVSSGAVSSGASRLANSPWVNTHRKQAKHPSAKLKAAVGQPYLMGMYRRLGEFLHSDVCQLLVSGSDVLSPDHMQSLTDVIGESLAAGILPIVNGNDAVDHYELDNDALAAGVAVMLGADRLLLLTDVEGVLDAEGQVVREADPASLREIPVRATGSGRGGMRSKLTAAEIAAVNGIPAVIARAQDPTAIGRTIAGEAIGTLVSKPVKLTPADQSWLAGAAPSVGILIVNREAETSIRDGSSLFGSGIKRVKGEFNQGDVVSVLTPTGALIGRGIVNTSSVLLKSLRALRKDEVDTLLIACLAADSEVEFAAPTLPEGTRPQLIEALKTVQSHSAQTRFKISQDILRLLTRPAIEALVAHASGADIEPKKLPNVRIIERDNLFVFQH